MPNLTASRIRPKQFVVPAESAPQPQEAEAYFRQKLIYETDPSDVHHDMSSGVANFVLLDVRQPEAFAACHVPGAQHLHNARIREATTRHLDPSTPIVTYCWGPGCNGSTRAAARLSELGFTVKEMIGGLEYWRREGYAVEGTLGADAPFAGS